MKKRGILKNEMLDLTLGILSLFSKSHYRTVITAMQADAWLASLSSNLPG